MAKSIQSLCTVYTQVYIVCMYYVPAYNEQFVCTVLEYIMAIHILYVHYMIW